ncbi:MAG: hypothetical protein U0746_07530 [Gemmataceae bacterium]
MRTLAALVLSAGLVAAGLTLAQPPQGKGGGRGMGMGGQQSGVMLLSNKSVQEELKITDEQKEKLTAFATEQGQKMRDAMQELRSGGGNFGDPDFMKKMQEATKKLGDAAMHDLKEKKLLKDEQLTRFKQINYQQLGVAGTVADDNVQKSIKLTGDQKDKLKAMAEEYQKDNMELRGFDPDTQTKRTALRKEYKEKTTNVLTADQKKAWTELVGKEFEIKIETPNFGGGKGGKRGKGKQDPAE